MNNRSRSQILIKSIDSYFEKQSGETQVSFHNHKLEIFKKEKVSFGKLFSVLRFLFYMLLVCLSQFMTYCVLPSQTKN